MNERRLYQRLNLTRSVEGKFGDLAVRIIDVSASGAQIEFHGQEPLPDHAPLQFRWRNRDITIDAELIRATDDRAGLKFVEDSAILRELIAESAAELLAAQQANLAGDRDKNVIGSSSDEVGEATITAASAGLKAKAWLMYTLGPDGWKRRKSTLPDQPPDGFTVAGNEHEEQIEMLCRTYETGDEESRRMIRLLAELSASSVLGTKRRS